jgi:aldose 1-epimerase
VRVAEKTEARFDPRGWPGGLARLCSGSAEALVAPGIGANCVRFRVDGRDVLEPPLSPADLRSRPAWAGCPVLFPLPGRLTQGRYTFEGREYRLPLNAPDGAALVHGFTPRRPWRLEAHDEASCTLAFDQRLMHAEEVAGYPWPFRLILRWSVQPGTLRADVAIHNAGSKTLPFGFGLHPYFLTSPADRVRVPARAVWPNEGGVPTDGPGPASGDLAWAELPEGGSLLLSDVPARIVQASIGRTRLRFDGRVFPEVVVYRPAGRPSLAIEPWTSVSSAAALLEPGAAHGLRLLEPGATWSAWVEIAATGDEETV